MTTRAKIFAAGRPRLNYPFRLRDPVTGIWVRARFLADRQDIAGCCAAWEIRAPPVRGNGRR